MEDSFKQFFCCHVAYFCTASSVVGFFLNKQTNYIFQFGTEGGEILSFSQNFIWIELLLKLISITDWIAFLVIILLPVGR